MIGATLAHTLRLNLQQTDNDQWNLGVGGFDLSERAYARQSRDAIVRISESGPLTRAMFAESRLQVRQASSAFTSQTELPTIRVLDAFTAGGAQQAGAQGDGSGATGRQFEPSIDCAQRGFESTMEVVRFGKHRKRDRGAAELETAVLLPVE